ncbi:hypothetical protein GCM10027047_01830 [Rhodococcus aerolatus]
MTRLRTAALVVAAVLGALITLGAVMNVAAGQPHAGNAVLVGLALVTLGPGLRVARNRRRLAEHRALAARADAAYRGA